MSDSDKPFGADTIVIPFTMEGRPVSPRTSGRMTRMRPAGWLYRYGVVQEPEADK